MHCRTLALTALALASLAGTAHAQQAITGTGITIDFTGYTATGLAAAPTAGQLDSDAWRVLGLSDDTTVAFGEDHTADDFARGAAAGHPTTGGLYSFTTTPGSPNFGFQGAGSDMTPGAITLKLVNSTGAAITDLTIAYEVWVYNDEVRGNTLVFAHDADDVAPYTNVAALDFTSPEAADGVPAWVLTTRTTALTGLNIANGANYYLRWSTDDSLGTTGSRDELAIDDIVISVPGCGDNITNGAEECDVFPFVVGDGCSDTCEVEAGFSCTGSPSVCTTGCGNGTVNGSEQCDVGAFVAGDGCSDICREEVGYDCTGNAPSVCTPVCGDHVVISPETCDDDDGTPTAGDGCSATCAVETGFTCPTAGAACLATCGDGLLRGGETCDDDELVAGDGCSVICQEEAGYDCGIAEPSVCTSTCGDSVVAVGDETCDDGDALGTDGCSAVCALEPGWVCAVAGAACLATCGDGLVVGAEACDDNDTMSDDGCNVMCAEEHGWTCAGMPSICASDCGDGLIASNEECDDSGMTAGDGCDEGCGVETGYVCSAEPSVCVEDTLCGNGALDGVEECDDGARDDDDGCSNGCTVEFGYVCEGEPSECLADGDNDGVPDADDNCPNVANPTQPDEDEDGIGDICDDEPAVPGPDGCCTVGTGTGERGGWLLLGAFVMLGLRRRRR